MRKERSGFFWDVTAFFCLATAFVAGLTGSLLTTTWILNGQLHPWLRALGLILLMFAIPIFVLGGHCLDLGDRKTNATDRAFSVEVDQKQGRT